MNSIVAMCERHNLVMAFIRHYLQRLPGAEYTRIRTGDYFGGSRISEAGVIFDCNGSRLVVASDEEAAHEAALWGY